MSVLRMSTGRSFQVVGPETRKLRQPKRDSTRGTTRSPWSADLRRERAVTVCTGISLYPNETASYGGAIVRAATPSRSTYPLLSYNVFTADTLHYAVTLTFDLLTLNVCSVSANRALYQILAERDNPRWVDWLIDWVRLNVPPNTL